VFGTTAGRIGIIRVKLTENNSGVTKFNRSVGGRANKQLRVADDAQNGRGRAIDVATRCIITIIIIVNLFDLKLRLILSSEYRVLSLMSIGRNNIR
jgi:hypothetical protein